jgi:hypothetical protein
MQRCYSPKSTDFEHYGGRGIKACDRWHSAKNFVADIKALGPRPSSKHSLDRINNDGNYEPGNMRWATSKEQNDNRRPGKAQNAASTILALRKQGYLLQEISHMTQISIGAVSDVINNRSKRNETN